MLVGATRPAAPGAPDTRSCYTQGYTIGLQEWFSLILFRLAALRAARFASVHAFPLGVLGAGLHPDGAGCTESP